MDIRPSAIPLQGLRQKAWSKERQTLCCSSREKTETIDGNGKKVRTYQSPEQKQWQEEVERQGYMYAVYRDVEEFVEIVNGYLTR